MIKILPAVSKISVKLIRWHIRELCYDRQGKAKKIKIDVGNFGENLMSKFNLYSLRFSVGNSLHSCYAISRLTFNYIDFPVFI